MAIRQYVNLVLEMLTLSFVPSRLRLPCFIMLGIAGGCFLAVLHISRATSYMGHSPETCMNCHVMTDAYITWSHSSHGTITTCVDCHLPHNNIVSSLAFKAMDGMKHSAIFIAGKEPQVIELSSMAIPVVNDNCKRCHEPQLSRLHPSAFEDDGQSCWSCHPEVPHGKAHSLSSTPAAMRPQLPAISEFGEDLKIGKRPARPLKNGDKDE